MRSTLVFSLAVSACLSLPANAADIPWTQLSLSTSEVDAYLRANPEMDGRGIVIAVLDTGVDMDVAGLRKTSTGDVKVVDVQDFSKQGNVDYKRAIWNNGGDRIIHYASDGSPELYTPPVAQHRPEGTTAWFGMLKEKAFKNSAVPDVNDNGRKDDTFGFCVMTHSEGTSDDAVCFIDTNSDRDFSDEKPMRNYKLKYETFTFHRAKKEKQTEPLTIALNIFPRKRQVVFHFDDGGHGTHVAGIAAGHRILGKDGFNGVAPGAKVISLKLGHNSLAGGATTTGSKKKAFEYAARYARENEVTVVCNLSYGIGSIREGHSDIDKFLDKLLRQNPNLIVCTSAGNEGPGLSCVGTPAAAGSAISVAALLAVDTAQDIRAEKIDAPQLTQFSLRGGELDKPDVATPGMMTSTVPRWNKGRDFWQGTSMASPYAAGLAALLANRVCASGQGVPRADIIKQALKASCRPIKGYNCLDYGAGVPNMVRAAELVDDLARTRSADPLYGFKITTDSPLAVDGVGNAAYWRTRYFPVEKPQVFTIKPLFVPSTEAKDLTAFSKRLLLKSDSDWCSTKQEQIYFRGEQSATVQVDYNASKLGKPGLYVATIEGTEEGTVLMRLVNSVVVPHRVTAEDNYRLVLDSQVVHGWIVNRHFVEVPAGASAMHITLKGLEDKPSSAWMYGVFRPDGRAYGRRVPVRLDTRNDRYESKFTISKDLDRGIWELPITSRGADEESHYTLEVRFDGIHADKTLIADLDSGPGSAPGGKVTLTNVFDRPTIVSTSGQLEGYRKEMVKKLTTDDDTAKITLKFTKEIKAARIKIEVSNEDYAKFTDCAVNVYDGGGKAIAQDGLGEPMVTLTANNPDSGADSTSAKLEIRPAFTHPDRAATAEFNIKIDYLYAEPIGIDVAQGDNHTVTLYPGIPTELSWDLHRRPEENPAGTSRLGYIHAKERLSDATVVDVTILEEE